MAGSQAVIDIRQLFEPFEFEDAVRLQKQVWGFSEIDVLPVRLFVVANKIGGHVFGAFDGRTMVGFCLAIPGLKPGGRFYLHSHMLGVLPDYQDCGVGRRLKLVQREEALARGIELVEWTFDPLAVKNAFFNIERLGAVIRRYVDNQYGITTSTLHGSLPTDRCIAEWWVGSPRVRAILAGERPPEEIVDRIEVPAAIDTLRTREPKLAREIQRQISEKFHRVFDQGLAVVGFERGDSKSAYLVGREP